MLAYEPAIALPPAILLSCSSHLFRSQLTSLLQLTLQEPSRYVSRLLATL